MAEGEEKKKIIVDDDWKAQAQAEKEKLATEAEAPAPAGAAAAEGAAAENADQAGVPHQLPPASFSTLISALVTQVLMSLGGYEDPQTKKRYIDLDLAKHHIDMLAVIEKKTAGNLADDEKKLLDSALYETRMQYVQVAQSASPGGM